MSSVYLFVDAEMQQVLKEALLLSKKLYLINDFEKMDFATY